MIKSRQYVRQTTIRKLKTLPGIRPNAGTQAQFRQRLERLIDQMNVSVTHWLSAAYRKNEPVLAQDELPADALKRIVRKLGKRWQKTFDEAAEKIAEQITKSIADRVTKQLQRQVAEHDITVRFQMTRAMRDAVKVSMAEQVSLIRNIPQQYFTDIEGAVMRSVAAGRDLSVLTKALVRRHGIEKRRAARIARDQNNKATATLSRVRNLELGLTTAHWMHSHAGKVPRPTHLANNGKKYDIAKGWYDPDADGKGRGRWIQPGELVNCRCFPKPVVPGWE